MPANHPIIIVTRGSALALAQSNHVLAQCREAFPTLRFELKIIKTTGDKLQSKAPKENESLPKGLFTKELEVALLKHRADMAVHSLKDLPTELPEGLTLGAIGKRADVRDVLIYRDAEFLRAEKARETVTERPPGQAAWRGYKPKTAIKDFPAGATIATSSTRRKAQLLAHNGGLKVVEIRGNVGTRIQRLAERPELDGIVLAAAGLARLDFTISSDGRLTGDAVPDGMLATILEPEIMLPCVGQGAIGIETRAVDERIATICERLNHFNTQQCAVAERAFLAGMGGGCQSPVAAYAEVVGNQVRLRAASFVSGPVRRAEGKRPIKEAAELGAKLAQQLK
jgi:hydroxymethylbilane synthase